LEGRWGPQPDHALIFPVLREDGPAWTQPEGADEPVPLAWSKNDYDRWAARVWRPAWEIAAKAKGAPSGRATMTIYDCRHTAISMALHPTLVMTAHGDERAQPRSVGWTRRARAASASSRSSTSRINFSFAVMPKSYRPHSLHLHEESAAGKTTRARRRPWSRFFSSSRHNGGRTYPQR
jgi:hypothetical protein